MLGPCGLAMRMLDSTKMRALPYPSLSQEILMMGVLLFVEKSLFACVLALIALEDGFRRRHHEFVWLGSLVMLWLTDHTWDYLAPFWPSLALLTTRVLGSFQFQRPGWSVIGMGDILGAVPLALWMGGTATCLAFALSSFIGSCLKHHHHPLLRDSIIILCIFEGLNILWFELFLSS